MGKKPSKQKIRKEFGVIGLGRMGGDLALQAIEKGWRVVGYNRSPERTRALAKKGLVTALSFDELVSALKPSRVVLIYVPHGDPTRQMIAELKGRLEKGDVAGDGGNSKWTDSLQHYKELKPGGINVEQPKKTASLNKARTTRGAVFHRNNLRKSGASDLGVRENKKRKQMKKLSSIAAALAIIALSGATAFLVGCKHNEGDSHRSGHVHQYTCAHHPEVVQSTPGNCPKCGMKLTHKE